MILRFFSLLILLLAVAGLIYLVFADVPVTQIEVSKEITIDSTPSENTQTP